MTLKTYEFTTDLIIDIEPNQNIRFFQNDHNSAHLVFFITDRKQPVNLTNAKVKIVLQKPDGTIVFQDNCTPIDAAIGKYEVILNTQTLVIDGKGYGQVHIEDGDKILECRKFEFFIDKSILSQDAIESTNEFLALQKAIQAGVKLEGIDIDEIVAAGNVVQEVVQARVDFEGYTYPTLKERIDAEQKKIGILQKVAIDITNYNPDPTGVNDSTSAFINTASYANSVTNVTSLPVGILLPPGVYRINKNADLNIPSLICTGGTATLIIEDSYSFIISSNFIMSNINVVSKKEYANTDSSYKPLFKATSTTDNISFENVIFDSQLSVSDGSKRASACIDLKIVKNCKLNNVTVKGYRRFFTSVGTSSNIKGMNIHMENVEVGIYVQGSPPNITDTNYAKNIQFENVSHINTQTQGENFFKQAGADTFLFEKCDTIVLSNLITEWAVERGVYFSSCNNAMCNNWQIKECEGIKFVGYVRYDTGLNNIADTCRISNISLITLIKNDAYLFATYFSKNIVVKNCTINGGDLATSAISTSHHIENLVIEDIYAENLKRGFFEFMYHGTIPAQGSIPANPDGNYPSGINGLKVNKVTIKSSHAPTFNYHVFKVSDISGVSLPVGTYRHKDIALTRINVSNLTDVNFGAQPSVPCQGLISIDDVKNLRILDNNVYGYTLLDGNSNLITLPFQIGAKTKNVQIRHKEYSNNRDNKYFFGTIYVSPNSEIEILTSMRKDAYEDRAFITIKGDDLDSAITKDLSQNYRIKGTTIFTNATDFALPLVGYNTKGTNPEYSIPTLFGFVEVVSSNNDVGRFALQNSGSVSLQSGASTLFATVATSGKFAIFKDGSVPRYTLRYMAGTSLSFVINYTLGAM